MKKFILFLSIFSIFMSCSSGDNRSVKEFVVVDQSSNKVLNSYEYSTETNELVKTVSYDQKENIERNIEYEYDNKGFLLRTIESGADGHKKIISYETAVEYDSAGRPVKIIRTSSEGEIVETNFGYDESGTLRGVVEQVNKGNVLMKDY